MHRIRLLVGLAILVGLTGSILVFSVQSQSSTGVTTGKPAIKSMGTLEFTPDGWLLIGDSRAGALWAVKIEDPPVTNPEGELRIANIEEKIAAMLGTTADEILIHDMAVNPLGQTAYISVSRGRGKWESRWQLPNDLEDATILLRIDPHNKITEFSLDDVQYSTLALPNPVDESKEHRWKDDTLLRVDTVTDIVYDNGKVYVAGLSNEEFASTMWQVTFPFDGDASYTTLEVFHGAHGEYETHAPIRTFVPYTINSRPSILASYLCTPLVTFPISDLANGQHVTGTTVAEFGSGNYPLDMLLCKSGDKEFFVLSNSMLPLMTIDPADVEKYNEPITAEVQSYAEGVPFTARSGNGIQQMDSYSENFLVALQRLPSGHMDLVSLSVKRLAQ